MWVYMKPVENLIESGAADLQHHKYVNMEYEISPASKLKSKLKVLIGEKTLDDTFVLTVYFWFINSSSSWKYLLFKGIKFVPFMLW